MLENLKEEVLQLQIQNKNLTNKLKSLTDRNQEWRTVNNDKYYITHIVIWQDYNLTPFYKTFSGTFSLSLNDVLFVDPSLSQLLKSGDLYQVTETLTSFKYDKVNFSFVYLNNGNVKMYVLGKPDVVENSTHRSLAMHSKEESTVFHMDSANGL